MNVSKLNEPTTTRLLLLLSELGALAHTDPAAMESIARGLRLLGDAPPGSFPQIQRDGLAMLAEICELHARAARDSDGTPGFDPVFTGQQLPIGYLVHLEGSPGGVNPARCLPPERAP